MGVRAAPSPPPPPLPAETGSEGHVSDERRHHPPPSPDAHRGHVLPPAPRPLRQVLHILPVTPAHPCPYMPQRIARDRGFTVEQLSAEAWESLLQSGWRRAGAMIYEPVCPMCRQCIPMRLPVGRLQPNRSQRKCLARNADLTVRLTPTSDTDERAELYQRYITGRHTGMMSGSRREFRQFLGISPVDSLEVEYRAGDRLIAVGTVDRLPGGWSCVYCYYDPEEQRRSLGTFNVLKSVELCRTHCPAGDDAYLYLGYWVPGSETMEYKRRFHPYQILGPDGRWYERQPRGFRRVDGEGSGNRSGHRPGPRR